MMKSFCCLWILMIVIQASIQMDDLNPLNMDQARLNITNQNYPEPIVVKQNLVVCEKCTYDFLSIPLEQSQSELLRVDTRYAHQFQLFLNLSNVTVSCNKESYSFREYGVYSFEISGTSPNNISCLITPQQPEPNSIDYWLPIVIGFGTFLVLILIIQLLRCASRSERCVHLCPKAVRSDSLLNDFTMSLPRTPILVANETADDTIGSFMNRNELTLTGTSSRTPVTAKPKRYSTSKRLRALDTFRGFSLMMMVFVNYGGGGYWFFKHSIWNGLTVADVVFPWFTWMIGISIVLSQRSLRARNVRKAVIFFKICRRTLILFLLGLILQAGYNRFVYVRIFGVLQRLALCYFFTALIVLIFDDKEDEPYNTQWETGDGSPPPLRSELKHTVFHYWPQWLIIFSTVLAWILITFIPKFEDCPRGYLGPGGKHDHGAYQNCTGGIAGYIDRKILRSSHLFGHPTCKDIYKTEVPFDPEGLLGILTGTFLCYLGVQAGHSFAHATSVSRVCGHWLVSGVLCGAFGLILSKGGQSDSWIPINKNLWSLSFVLILAGLAFVILTILYLLVDVSKSFTGEPFLWLGMNSIIIYVGHEACGRAFPVQFQVEQNTHAQLIAMHLYGVIFWTIVAGLMYRQKFFIAV